MPDEPIQPLTNFGRHEGIAISALLIALVALPLGTWAYTQNNTAKIIAARYSRMAALTSPTSVTVATPTIYIAPTQSITPVVAVYSNPQTSQPVTNLKPSQVGQAYSAIITFVTAKPVTNPVLVASTLPPGLSLYGCPESKPQANGTLVSCVLGGTPIYSGVNKFTVELKDIASHQIYAGNYSVSISP